MSGKGELSKQDWKRIGTNLICFNLPTFLITLLTSAALGHPVGNAVITASVTLVTAFMDLARKYMEGDG